VLKHESLLHNIIKGKCGEGYTSSEKNAPTEQPDEESICGTQKNSWRRKSDRN